MSYQSLYRKYRPTDFTNVVGQQNIIQTLTNAISKNNIGHAYIFSGPRGCGKTSIAKIFAQKVNCTCEDNSCSTCKLFASGSEIADIWEIDAASNNGVDEIRRIIENVSYMPMDLKYKVYIIDEVHMLSKAAFNALLKTLEEPPEHAIFILATTEIYKIPLTILSRCQRFDFKRIEVSEIVSRLKYVLDQEVISYEEEALIKIAKLADGGMRDALSIVEKVKSYNPKITIGAVNDSLQLVGESQMEQLLDLLIQGDLNHVVAFWHELLHQGIDENKFILDMQYYIRDLLLLNNDKYSKSTLIHYLKTFSELDSRLQFTNNYSLLIEVYLIEMATYLEEQPISKVIQPQNIKKSPETNINTLNHQETLKMQSAEILKQTKTSTNEINENDSRPTDVIDFLMGEDEKLTQTSVKKITKTVNEVVSGKEVVESNENNLVILDVLMVATVNNKKEILNYYPQIKVQLEEQGKYGLAKFFEYSTIQAASDIGYVITIDMNYLSSYQKRIQEIEDIFYKYTSKKGKIFLLDVNEWLAKRPEYIKRIKESKEKDIFKKAQEEFGTDIVVKI